MKDSQEGEEKARAGGEKGGRDGLEDEERQTERVGVEEESFPGGFL